MESEFSYDKVAYPALTFPLTHPDHLAVMGTLNGLDPVDPQRCRVLELGCGSGANLLSFAYTLPDSVFVGVDISHGRIADAQKGAADLGLSNIEFIHQNLLEYSVEKFGRFDIIIAHGLFSWVSDAVRDKILEIYRTGLSPNGIGYISYNVYPGCRLREIVQDAMQFHVDEIADLNEKASQAIKFLEFLENGAASERLYQSIIKHERELLLDKPRSAVMQDDLSGINKPYYFHQFASLLFANGLQFVSESDPSKSLAASLPEAVRETIDELRNDLVRREQYIDFLVGRRFRRTLVCRADAGVDPFPLPETVIRHFEISSKAKHEPTAGNGKENHGTRFIGKRGLVDIVHPMTKAALEYLGALGAKAVPFNVLIAEIGGTVGQEAEIDATAENLIELFRAGFVQLYMHQTPFAGSVEDKPHASDFARWQLRGGGTQIRTLIGEDFTVTNEFLTKLIIAADGTRDRAALTREMLNRVKIEKGQKASFKRVLPAMMEGALTKLAEVGLLQPAGLFRE